MTSHRVRVLAPLGVLAITLGACASTDPDPAGSGGVPSTGGATASPGGANGSGTGGVAGTGGVIATGGVVGTSGQAGSGGAAGSGGSGTGGTGGTGSAGMPAGGAGGMAGGTSAGCKEGLGLCDDFESYPEGTAPYDSATSRWMPVRVASPGTSLKVDSMNAYSGSKALHITGTDLPGGIGDTKGTIVISTKPGDSAFPPGTKAGFVRFMMFLKTFTQSGSTHGRIVRVGDSTITSLNNPQGYAFDLHFNKPATFKIEKFNDVYFGSVDPVPLKGKWVCWEQEYGPTTLNFWQDGKLVTNSSKFPGGLTLTTFALGFESYTPLPAIDFWLDDVAFDAKQRIGCPAAK